MGPYLTMDELDDLFQSMLKDYRGELIYEMEIGRTFEDRSMMAYIFMLGSTESKFENDLKARKSIVIDGVHHARELTTIS